MVFFDNYERRHPLLFIVFISLGLGFATIIALLIFQTKVTRDFPLITWLLVFLSIFSFAFFILACNLSISDLREAKDYRNKLYKGIHMGNNNNIKNFLKKEPMISIRGEILSRLIAFSITYCLLSLFVLRIILVEFKLYLFSYLAPDSINELMDKTTNSHDYYYFIMSIYKYVFLILYDYNWLFIISFSFLFIWIYTSKSKVSFICPHCLKKVLFNHLHDISCRLCDTEGHSRFELLFYCSSCRESIDYFNCPHCQQTINIKDKYDQDNLLKKRKENVKLKPILLTGLRGLYNRKKRLPQFICKHCLKVLIAKNYNLTCPHCMANYLVTDNRTQVQVGDVKINNFRHIVDESTMEKVLFDKCIQCGGIIEVIECYHNDCGKDIDLTEEYDEVELLEKRYGKN